MLQMLKGKKILLAITGSIAAYKSIFLLRSLIKGGADVTVVMTRSATDFINPLTFSTLSGKPVLLDISNENVWVNHVHIGRGADLMIIAPASCNTMAKMASGLCDNLLMAIYLSATCPILVVPAMDEDMWNHPSTQNNLATLKKYGHHVMKVNSGELASGLTGEGRMAEPEEIMSYIMDGAAFQKRDLENRRALVTAGPTHEAIDPVRYIGNHSSGKMGIALARELTARGAEVTLVAGPVSVELPAGIHIINVLSARQMLEAVMENLDGMDYIIMAAAVADYTPVKKAEQKIKKSSEFFSINLEKTTDILTEVGKMKTSDQVLTGFALETENEVENAKSKLKNKQLDFIVLNSLNDKGAGFSYDTNKITIFDKAGNKFDFPLQSKKSVAAAIVNTIIQKNE